MSLSPLFLCPAVLTLLVPHCVGDEADTLVSQLLHCVWKSLPVYLVLTLFLLQRYLCVSKQHLYLPEHSQMELKSDKSIAIPCAIPLPPVLGLPKRDHH
jgi:hypothetical protein